MITLKKSILIKKEQHLDFLTDFLKISQAEKVSSHSYKKLQKNSYKKSETIVSTEVSLRPARP